MKALVQRVKRGERHRRRPGRSGRSVAASSCAGVEHGDAECEPALLAHKVANLRIFEDDAGQMNRSVLDMGGRRARGQPVHPVRRRAQGQSAELHPRGAAGACEPALRPLCDAVAAQGAPVARGEFAAHMAVGLVNDGPVTIWLDTATLPGSPEPGRDCSVRPAPAGQSRARRIVPILSSASGQARREPAACRSSRPRAVR